MAKHTKLIHFTIIDGTVDEVTELKNILSELREKLSYDIEFLVTNDKVESSSVDKLLDKLIELYKNDKKVKK